MFVEFSAINARATEFMLTWYCKYYSPDFLQQFIIWKLQQ